MPRPATLALALLTLTALVPSAEADPKPPAKPGPLDPRGRMHIPIGVPDTVDTLKTFVEPEGNFSPGVGSYGVYFWVYDHKAGKLTAPTMDGVKVDHGLAPGGLPIPWSRWKVGDVVVRSEVCQVEQKRQDAGKETVCHVA